MECPVNWYVGLYSTFFPSWSASTARGAVCQCIVCPLCHSIGVIGFMFVQSSEGPSAARKRHVISLFHHGSSKAGSEPGLS